MNLIESKSQHLLVTTLTALLLSFPLASSGQSVIKKCQDSDGKWHYGQHASQHCVSDVDAMRHSGTPVAEPLEEAEKKAKAKDAPSEDQLAQQASDEAILRRYSSVEALDSEMQRKLNDSDKQIEVATSMIENLSSDIEYYKAKPQTEKTLAEIQKREKSIAGFTKRTEEDSAKKVVIQRKYSELKTQYIDAAARLAETQ